ncbi:hypothetical protein [Burkholderia ubonensis]|nr:hypothetical protein [Burkholderia ubonensis]
MEIVGVFLVYVAAILVGVLAYFVIDKRSSCNQPDESNDSLNR